MGETEVEDCACDCNCNCKNRDCHSTSRQNDDSGGHCNICNECGQKNYSIAKAKKPESAPAANYSSEDLQIFQPPRNFCTAANSKRCPLAKDDVPIHVRTGNIKAEYNRAAKATAKNACCDEIADGEISSNAKNLYLPKYGLLRHTVEDMRNLTLSKENAAADIFANAECMRYEGDRITKSVAEKTIALQRISTDRLKSRGSEIFFWKKELERLILEMREETHLLEELRIRTDNAIRATADIILHIVNECLRRRLSRIGIDLTYDEVEVELQKERDMLLKAQRALDEFAVQIREQIGKNRAAKECLERDWSNKVESHRIDDLASQLKPDSHTILNYAGVARFQEGMTSVPKWEEMTRKNLEDAEREFCASGKLRELVPEFLKRTASQLRVQADNVESGMSRVLKETESAKSRLTHQLKLVLEEMVKTENAIANIKRAMRGDRIESALKLAQTRLYNRTFRPNYELTRDCPQFALIQEVHEISRSQNSFEDQLRSAEDTLHKIRQIRVDLEKEIAVKDNTLVICRERCQIIRAFWPSVVTLAGN